MIRVRVCCLAGRTPAGGRHRILRGTCPGPDCPGGPCRQSPDLVWRAGYARPVTTQATDYLPGDLVAWNLGGNLLHVGIVSARQSVAGVPQMLLSIGAGTQEEDILFRFAIIGHFRLWLVPQSLNRAVPGHQMRPEVKSRRRRGGVSSRLRNP